jgi:hypothetical protein
MFTTLFLILVIVAAFSLLWWGFGRMSIPEPFKTVLLVGLGLLGLWFIYTMVVNGGHVPALR